jgi:ParB/RepB/Spo0J family partition protein
MKLLTTVDETKLGPVQYHGNRLMVQIERVAPDPDQPRTVFDKEKLAELVESVRVFGILQDLMVRPSDKGDGYVILDGERRWRAAKLVGLKVVPVSVRVVTGPSMISALQLTAN